MSIVGDSLQKIRSGVKQAGISVDGAYECKRLLHKVLVTIVHLETNYFSIQYLFAIK